MNIHTVTQATLSMIAKFTVSSVIEVGDGVSLLGIEFTDAHSMSKKSFWKEYRACSRRVISTE